MRPYLLFIALVLAGLAITAILGSVMDARLIDQEQRREETYRSG